MVLLGGLELVAAGYIVHKHSKNKKERRRLEEEAAVLEQQQHQQQLAHHRHHRQKHSHDRKHSHNRRHDKKYLYEGREPSQDQRPQHPYTDTSHPPRATSAPPQQTYPPTGWPAHWNAPTEQQHPYMSSTYLPNYNDPNNYPYPMYPPPRPVNASRNEKSSPLPTDSPPRGRTETRPSDNTAELSASGPRTCNTHLNPTPHVRFAVPNDEPQPGDQYDPPPEYRV